MTHCQWPASHRCGGESQKSSVHLGAKHCLGVKVQQPCHMTNPRVKVIGQCIQGECGTAVWCNRTCKSKTSGAQNMRKSMSCLNQYKAWEARDSATCCGDAMGAIFRSTLIFKNCLILCLLCISDVMLFILRHLSPLVFFFLEPLPPTHSDSPGFLFRIPIRPNPFPLCGDVQEHRIKSATRQFSVPCRPAAAAAAAAAWRDGLSESAAVGEGRHEVRE